MGGVRLYLLGHGFTPHFRITYPDGTVRDYEQTFAPQPNDPNFTSQGAVKVTDPPGVPVDQIRRQQLAIVGIFAPTAALQGSVMTSSFPSARQPGVAVDVYRGDLLMEGGRSQSVFSIDTSQVDKGLLVKQARSNLMVGESITLDDGTRITFTGYNEWVSLQLCALWAFTFTITGSLPGISHLRALTVNLAGSLVANTVPFGGVLAVGATYTMCRSWGFSRAAIGISITLGGGFATAGKVLLPLLGLAALLVNSAPISPGLRAVAGIGVASLVVVLVLVLFATVMISSRAAHAAVGLAERTAQAPLQLVRRPRQLGWQAKISRLRAQTGTVWRDGWVPMTCWPLGYFALYYVLFWVSLRSVGMTTDGGAVLAAFALGWLLTSVAVTPGGIGVAEAGSVALLISLGADPSPAASGVLLFTIFTHILEIPFGAIAWLVWLSTPPGFGKGAAMIGVLVVDDDAAVRVLLARVLGGADGIQVVGECGDGTEVPNLVDSTRPDVVLMDVHMPRMSGLDATHDLLARYPSTRGILLTASTSTRTVAAAAQAGAVGFLVKGGAHDRLISAVRTVAAGGTAWPIDPQVAGAAPGK